MNRKIGGETVAMDGAPVMHSLPRVGWSGRSGTWVASGVASRVLLSKDIVAAHFQRKVQKKAKATVIIKG